MSAWRVATTLVLCACAVGGDRYHPAERGARSQVAGRAEASADYWYREAQAAIDARAARAARAARLSGSDKARNVVMFMGDGMSVPTLAAARTLLGQRQGNSGEEASMSFENFPAAGLVKTYCVNAQVADSACTATAYLCGVKANSGTIGVTAGVPRGDCDASTDTAQRVKSIAEWALEDGRDAGIVTTTRVTHASPSGAFAKVAERNWEHDALVDAAGFDTQRCPDIAHQLVHMSPANQFKVIFGGGRRNFRPSTVRDEEGVLGRRGDNRDLIEEWQLAKQASNATYKYLWHRDELMALNVTDDMPEYLLGLFEANHLRYNLLTDPVTEPTLAELTEVAIRSLSRNEKGFFLFVEGGRIDHAHHDNLAELALDETLELDAAVARAAQLLHEDDSLIVVTADHAHVMAFNGYSRRGNPILGPSVSQDNDTMPYMTLSYINGPGFRPHVNDTRPDVTTEENYGTPNWRTHVDVPLESETHGGDDVAVFARGPHHAMFTGLYEQSQLPHLMAYAACIGPGQHACTGAAHAHIAPLAFIAIVALLTTLGLQ